MSVLTISIRSVTTKDRKGNPRSLFRFKNMNEKYDMTMKEVQELIEEVPIEFVPMGRLKDNLEEFNKGIEKVTGIREL